MTTIFISENDRRIKCAFSSMGYNTKGFSTFRDIQDGLKDGSIDVLIIDRSRMDDSMDLLRRTRRQSRSVIVIILSDRHDETDRLKAFLLGCDDYQERPLSIKELQLRVNAFMRQTSMNAENMIIYSGGKRLQITAGTHNVNIDGTAIPLTESECSLLVCLARNTGHAVNRKQLSSCLNPKTPTERYTIDAHMSNIRRKLGRHSWILTIRGFGYMLSGSRIYSGKP